MKDEEKSREELIDERDLRDRELNCLLNISELIDNPDLSLEELIQGIVDLIPSGLQYPDIAWARAVVEDTEYKTETYRETEQKQQYPIEVDSRRMGSIEVGYREKVSHTGDSPFLEQEKRILKMLGEQIERCIQRKQIEEKLQYYASVDTMTGTLNRRTGLALLEEQMRLMKRNKSSLSICFIDVNKLKYVNDTFGHDEGDDLITIVTDIMRSAIRSSDTLCRLGSDEFLIILPDCRVEDAEKVWDKIKERLDSFNKNEEKPYRITLSHGTSEHKWDDHLLSDELLAAADKKMNEEKKQYKTE
jgi:diguanylate cyclase (GGDEF)-like protein